MTATSEQGTGKAADVEMVTGVIDGRHVTVPKGTMIIRAAEQLGIEIRASVTIRCWTRLLPVDSASSRLRGCPSRSRPARSPSVTE